MTNQERQQRAREVKELTENPHLIAALEQLESDAIERWKFSDPDESAKREEYWRQYITSQTFRAKLQAVLEDGQMAEFDEDRRQL